MYKGLIGISKAIIVIMLPLVIMLTLLQFYAFNKDFYLSEFKKYNVQQDTKMSFDDLERITEKVIGYLKNEEENLNIKAVVDGINTEVFGDREKQHMVDVKVLFQYGYRIRNIGLVIIPIALLLIYLLSISKKRDIWSAFLYSSILPIVLMFILFILVQIDFYKYFTYFHEIFFTNDLWLLNPKTDILIQMLPLGFFMDITIRVVTWLIVISVIIGGVSYYNLRRRTITPI